MVTATIATGRPSLKTMAKKAMIRKAAVLRTRPQANDEHGPVAEEVMGHSASAREYGTHHQKHTQRDKPDGR
jgi:hypothetical protein